MHRILKSVLQFHIAVYLNFEINLFHTAMLDIKLFYCNISARY